MSSDLSLVEVVAGLRIMSSSPRAAARQQWHQNGQGLSVGWLVVSLQHLCAWLPCLSTVSRLEAQLAVGGQAEIARQLLEAFRLDVHTDHTFTGWKHSTRSPLANALAAPSAPRAALIPRSHTHPQGAVEAVSQQPCAILKRAVLWHGFCVRGWQ